MGIVPDIELIGIGTATTSSTSSTNNLDSLHDTNRSGSREADVSRIAKALRWGCAAGASNVQRDGAAQAIPISELLHTIDAFMPPPLTSSNHDKGNTPAL